jgi:hypothetical protein
MVILLPGYSLCLAARIFIGNRVAVGLGAIVASIVGWSTGVVLGDGVNVGLAVELG